jgi:hypothetical protein
MANILGSIQVELKAKTAQFVSDLTKASNTARRTGKEIEGAFSKLGSVAGTALAPFGAMGQLVSSSLSGIGSALGKNLSQANKLGVLKAGLFGVAGAATAVVGGITALVAHTAAGAVAMGRLAQSAGVSVESFSGLAFAAKTAGISQESLAGSLEKMSKSAFAAATGPAKAVTAYSRLGIAVKDANGEIRPTGDLLKDVASKSQSMPDGATKTALAMALFGKSGAEMIPFLDKGGQGIADLEKRAKELGITLDDSTVASAQAFQRSMGLMAASGQGCANQLMSDLLPAFNAVSTGILDGLKDQGSALSWFVKSLGFVVKTFISTAGLIATIVKSVVGGISQLIYTVGNGIVNLGEALAKAFTGDFKGAGAALKDFVTEGKGQLSQLGSDFVGQYSSWARMATAAFTPIDKSKPGKSDKHGGSGVDTGNKEAHKHQKPEQQNPVSLALANAQERLRASQIELAAAGLDEQAKRKAEAAAKADEGIVKLGEQIARQKHIKTDDYASLVDSQTQATIRSTQAQIADNASKADLISTMASASRAAGQSIAQSNSLYSAIQRGTQAVQEANVQAQAENELLSKGASAAQVKSRAQQILDEQRAKDKADTQQSIEDAQFELDWQNRLNAALLQGAAAYNAVALAKAQAEINRGKGTPEQKSALSKQAELRAQQQAQEQVAQGVHDLVYADNERLALLRAQRAQLASMQLSPAVQLGLKQVDSEIAEIQDKTTLATGKASDGATVFFSQMARQARTTAQEMYEVLSDAFGSLNQELSALMTGQQANWESMFRGLAQHIAQLGLQDAESHIAKALGFKTKADGSQGNPFHVIADNLPTGVSSTGADGSASSPLSGIGLKLLGVFSKVGSALGSVFKGIGGALGKVFGGFFANGGDPEPYKTSVIGEHGPELFTPHVAGHVTSNKDLYKMLGGSTAYVSIDARNSNAAEVEMRVHAAMSRYYPSIQTSTIIAQRETQARSPRSRF